LLTSETVQQIGVRDNLTGFAETLALHPNPVPRAEARWRDCGAVGGYPSRRVRLALRAARAGRPRTVGA
jgi:hypothetical protein